MNIYHMVLGILLEGSLLILLSGLGIYFAYILISFLIINTPLWIIILFCVLLLGFHKKLSFSRSGNCKNSEYYLYGYPILFHRQIRTQTRTNPFSILITTFE